MPLSHIDDVDDGCSGSSGGDDDDDDDDDNFIASLFITADRRTQTRQVVYLVLPDFDNFRQQDCEVVYKYRKLHT